MSWYKGGTVAATNASTAIVGTGTSFISNKVQSGDAMLLADGKFYEIATVTSETALTLASPGYQGSTASGMAYAILPTNNRIGELATLAAQLLTTFADMRDGIGEGLFPDGTVAAPAMRFVNDQGTGFWRPAANSIAASLGSVEAFRLSAAGLGLGVTPATILDALTSGGRFQVYQAASTTGVRLLAADIANSAAVPMELSGTDIRFTNPSNSVVGMFDASGNLLVGTTTSVGWGTSHRITKSGLSEGSTVLSVEGGGQYAARFNHVVDGGYSAASAAIFVGKDSTSGRSINAGGTVNGSGADGAERLKRAPDCPLIEKGQVVGLDENGQLTVRWSESRGFALKSGLVNSPSFIGNDIYGSIHEGSAGPRPVAPAAVGPEPIPPVEPDAFATPMPERLDGEDDAAFIARMATWIIARDAAAAAQSAYETAAAAFPAAHAAWVEADASYQAALATFTTDDAAWLAGLEEERLLWDCISFYGQAYAKWTGSCAPGDYLIAVEDGDGIGVAAVAAADMTLPQYMRRIGRVLSIHPDHDYPLLDVQHG